MEQDDLRLNRRAFVKLAASTGAASFLAEETIYAGEPRRPLHPVVLQTTTLQVIFDEIVGTPVQYSLDGKSVSLVGDDTAAPIVVRVCQKDPWRQENLSARV